MKIKLVLPAIVFFSLSIIHFNCDTVTGPVSGVSGKIYSKEFIPLGDMHLVVQGQTSISSSDGSFKFANVTLPYDLTILDTSFRSVYIYKNLTLRDVSIPFPKYKESGWSAKINVHIPEEIFQPGVACKIIFTDKNYINVYQGAYSYNPQLVLDIRLSNDNVVTGKLIVLTYKINSEYKIISYENYGESPDIQIRSGDILNYNFDSSQLSLNPGEKDVECYVEAPSSSPYMISSFYLLFSSKNSLSIVSSQFSELTGPNLEFKIPTGIPDIYNTNIKSLDHNAQNYSFREITLNPDISNYLELYEPCVTTAPENNNKAVNNSTPFSFGNNTGTGIFEITLFDNTAFIEYKVYTADNNFTLDVLGDNITAQLNNHHFSWYVSELGPAVSTNDYVQNYFNEQNQFVTQSNFGFFTYK